MADNIPYDELNPLFAEHGAAAGLDNLIEALEKLRDHHALFRVLLLKKRHELGLPLLNPGDLPGCEASTRREYEEYVEAACRQIGQKYLDDGNIPQAWRYFRTLGEKEPVRQALEKVDAAHASEETIQVALEYGVHPQLGFRLLLENQGLCRAITAYDAEFSTQLEDKQYAAALLARQLYKDLVVGVSRQILERFGELPPETDLVDLIRHRPWLFENGATHADPQHVFAVSRIGLLATEPTDLIMTLSIAEYGRLLGPEHQPMGRAPFEDGFADCARFARALLGQNAEETVAHFRARLSTYDPPHIETAAVEMVVLLLWRTERKLEALDVWQQYLGQNAPELPGLCIPSYYELCVQAGDFSRLAGLARAQDDAPVWAAARILDARENSQS